MSVWHILHLEVFPARDWLPWEQGGKAGQLLGGGQLWGAARFSEVGALEDSMGWAVQYILVCLTDLPFFTSYFLDFHPLPFPSSASSWNSLQAAGHVNKPPKLGQDGSEWRQSGPGVTLEERPEPGEGWIETLMLNPRLWNRSCWITRALRARGWSQSPCDRQRDTVLAELDTLSIKTDAHRRTGGKGRKLHPSFWAYLSR